ncbi:hypothetical protein NMG60_11032809 [Bertholletia excelsa]
MSLENRVLINLSSRSKQEIRELRRKLEGELDLVRNWVKKIDGKEGQKTVGVDNRGTKRVHSEVASVGPPCDSRPFYKLSVSALESSLGVNDSVEKEKTTPRAKFPPADSNKKLKQHGKKQGGGECRQGFGLGKFSNQIFKSCLLLIDKLMKHKHGWVFNVPVDPQALGLHDYFDIIKNPMDLGTVKSRLIKNWYKTPGQFAEDVRLTFNNAMTYNPKGQDDKWTVLEADYMRELGPAEDCEVSLPTSSSIKTASLISQPIEKRGILTKSESMASSTNPKSKTMTSARVGRAPVAKKPMAKDIQNRDMTYEEKQELSMNLQNLPSEELENIVEIIKKRNSSLSQNDNEIELDIDSVDTETLWELDRFITTYKKRLSKSKGKAELGMQARAEVEPIAQVNDLTSGVAETSKEIRTVEKDVATTSPFQDEKQGHSESRSSSPGSSSGDSSSSSSDSDS